MVQEAEKMAEEQLTDVKPTGETVANGALAKGPYQIMPAMEEEQFALLKEDIRMRGVLQPIEFDQDGNIIDGHHRFRAFCELIDEGVDLPMYDKVVRKFGNDEERFEYVVALNVKRRHLTREQRQELAYKLKMPPFNWTLQKIGDALGVSYVTVWRDIEDLPDEKKAEVEAQSSVGADGRQYTAKYAPRMFVSGETQMRQMEASVTGAAGAPVQEIPPAFYVIVTCTDEGQQAALLERFAGEGLQVRALVS